jgi:hypothetical protein
MPKFAGREKLTQIIQEAKDKIPDNVSFDPEYHEKRAAYLLAYEFTSIEGLTRAVAHASLAVSLRLEAMNHSGVGELEDPPDFGSGLAVGSNPTPRSE